ncbi:MAG TPA: glycosyltransferase family 2 protein [Spirillospora sp.]|nr:glycosyltransferase family 2 protein [Spirillospora sp.]
MSNKVDISVVIPLYNEEESIEPLYEELSPVLDALDCAYEVVIVDDGSRDGSFERLKKIHARDPRWKVIRFRRNYGQTAALSAGFEAAAGDVVITLDADLQNDPRDIPKLLARLDEGYDIVSGWRKDRKEPFFSRRLPSMIANWLISRTTGVALHDYGCTLKAYRSVVVKNIHLYGELHRFIPAVASSIGVTVAEVPVNDRARRFGKSKYGIMRTFRVLLDLITVRFILSYSTRPLQIFGGVGLAMGALGLLIGLYLSYVKLVLGENIGDRPLLILAVLLIILAVQMISIGLVAEIVIRTYHEAQQKPIYMVREALMEADAQQPDTMVVEADHAGHRT